MSAEIMNIVLQAIVVIAAGMGGYMIRNINETSTRIGKTETEIENVRNMLDVKVKNLGERLDEKIVRLQMRNDVFRAEHKSTIHSINDNLGDLSSRMARVEEGIANMTRELQQKGTDISSVSGQIGKLESKVYSIRSDVNSAHRDIMTLSNRLDYPGSGS